MLITPICTAPPPPQLFPGSQLGQLPPNISNRMAYKPLRFTSSRKELPTLPPSRAPQLSKQHHHPPLLLTSNPSPPQHHHLSPASSPASVTSHLPLNPDSQNNLCTCKSDPCLKPSKGFPLHLKIKNSSSPHTARCKIWPCLPLQSRPWAPTTGGFFLCLERTDSVPHGPGTSSSLCPVLSRRAP